DERELVLDRLAECAGLCRLAERELPVGLARTHHDAEPRVAREMQHGLVLGQAVHEERPVAAIRCMQHCSLQQRAAIASVARGPIDAQAEFGRFASALERKMGHTPELEVRAEDAEGLILGEINSLGVGDDRRITHRGAEPQSAILRGQAQQVANHLRAVRTGQLLDYDAGRAGHADHHSRAVWASDCTACRAATIRSAMASARARCACAAKRSYAGMLISCRRASRLEPALVLLKL